MKLAWEILFVLTILLDFIDELLIPPNEITKLIFNSDGKRGFSVAKLSGRNTNRPQCCFLLCALIYSKRDLPIIKRGYVRKSFKFHFVDSAFKNRCGTFEMKD